MSVVVARNHLFVGPSRFFDGDFGGSGDSGVSSLVNSSLEETTPGVQVDLVDGVLHERLDDLQILVGSDYTKNLDGRPNHHYVRKLYGFERHRTSRITESWRRSLTLLDEVTQDIKITLPCAGVTVPRESSAVWAVKDKPEPHWIAGVLDPSP